MKSRGIGFGSGWQGANYHFGHPDISTVQIELGDDLIFRVGVAAADLGQGIPETTSLIVSKALGDIPLDQIVMIDPDTAATPDGGATGASRQTTITGNAALKAARNMLDLLKKIASELLTTAPSAVSFTSDAFQGQGDETVSLAEVVQEARKIGYPLIVTGSFRGEPTEALDEKGQGFGVNQFSYATYIAEVEVDTETGQIDVLRVSTFIDAGRIIRRKGAEMQVEGGVVMGLGHTLTEEFKQKGGWPQTKDFTTYLIPTIFDKPLRITSDFIDEPVGYGDLGVKGMAELVLVPVAPAIINAIYDAVGVYVTELPATPERILMTLKKAKKEAGVNVAK
jgi:nicotinate dehydrogenase medium molybdopterin subunit